MSLGALLLTVGRSCDRPPATSLLTIIPRLLSAYNCTSGKPSGRTEQKNIFVAAVTYMLAISGSNIFANFAVFALKHVFVSWHRVYTGRCVAVTCVCFCLEQTSHNINTSTSGIMHRRKYLYEFRKGGFSFRRISLTPDEPPALEGLTFKRY